MVAGAVLLAGEQAFVAYITFISACPSPPPPLPSPAPRPVQRVAVDTPRRANVGCLRTCSSRSGGCSPDDDRGPGRVVVPDREVPSGSADVDNFRRARLKHRGRVADRVVRVEPRVQPGRLLGKPSSCPAFATSSRRELRRHRTPRTPDTQRRPVNMPEWWLCR